MCRLRTTLAFMKIIKDDKTVEALTAADCKAVLDSQKYLNSNNSWYKK